MIVCIALCAACSHATREPAPAFAFAPPDDFNGVILVAEGKGEPSRVETYGVADAEADRKASRTTQYQIGSASKFLTAVTMLRLADKGKISLDAPIGTWLKDFPGKTKSSVTLRHLLTNRSGIPNGVMAVYKTDRSKVDRDMPAAEASRLFGSDALASEPGTQWDYSLTNWVLVRAIAEQASGMPFEQLMRQEVFAPLGMDRSGIPGMAFELEGAAAGYSALQPAPVRKVNRIPPYAAASGTVYSTVDDLRALMDGVYRKGYLSPASLRELTTVAVPDQAYALGGRVIDLTEGEATKILWEPGETGAYRAVIAYEPTTGACIVLLNNTGLPADQIGDSAKRMMREALRSPKR
ncbi:MAG TPA: serine hydrolase domain-containing protein [Luteimonas sp.]|nr:serine hydrolase domain-containing protein [Luteimonas sp.]